MTMAQARAILQKWREFVDEEELSESSELSDKNAPEVQFVPSTGIRIEEIMEEEPAVVYSPHPPTTVVSVELKD